MIHMNKNPVSFCGNIHIYDVSIGPLKKIAVPENAVKPDKILIFQVAPAAPF